VLAEPPLIQNAISQFSNLEMLLNAVETYVGTPYIWGDFNILIVPGNYPYGGMENPLLTFFSQAILTGTKSAS
jgi:leukotriene-A4 hydrolase